MNKEQLVQAQQLVRQLSQAALLELMAAEPTVISLSATDVDGVTIEAVVQLNNDHTWEWWKPSEDAVMGAGMDAMLTGHAKGTVYPGGVKPEDDAE